MHCLSLQNTSPDKHVEKLLMGNKCDLESERVVSYETAQKVSSVSCDLAGYHGINIAGRGTEHQLH